MERKIGYFQKFFPLGESIHKLISSYSHGMKQKVSIMASLLSDPKLWILDEPITGLDPQTANCLIEFMKQYAKSGRAVLFSSHNLDVVQKVCDKIVIINNGKVVSDINVQEFKKTSNISLGKYFMEKSR